jgi:endoribonuclease Dicer
MRTQMDFSEGPFCRTSGVTEVNRVLAWLVKKALLSKVDGEEPHLECPRYFTTAQQQQLIGWEIVGFGDDGDAVSDVGDGGIGDITRAVSSGGFSLFANFTSPTHNSGREPMAGGGDHQLSESQFSDPMALRGVSQPRGVLGRSGDSPGSPRDDHATDHQSEPLRNDQRQLVAEAVADDGNVVVVAGTGFGKTRVAFAVVAAALERHPDRVVVFLCPTVPLANQQREYWERSLPAQEGVTSAVVAGSGGAGFGRARVTFATPAKFVAEVSGSRRALARLSLLVLDECHHAHRMKSSSATGESCHPYSELAELYRDSPPGERPKLIGLTASPGEVARDVRGLAEVLLARFVCAPAAAAPATTVLATGGRGLALSWKLAALDADRLAAQRVGLKTGEYERVAAASGLLALWRAIGSGQALRAACAEVAGAEATARCLALDAEFRSAEQHQGDHSLGCDQQSPVWEVVVNELVRYHDSGGEHFRAIVFVDTQVAAHAAKRMLSHLASFRPGLLLGQNGCDGMPGMTMARQKECLAQFRRGDINVLVATSIAEEGLDIQRCGLVIRTEPPHSIISNIQGRGRARQLDATYSVVVLTETEEEVVEDLAKRELQARHVLVQCVANAGSGVAGTSWSHFDETQFATELLNLGTGADSTDWKSQLNVFLQQRDRPTSWQCVGVEYDCVSTGPPHAPAFVATAMVSGVRFKGKARSTKKSSEQTAAYVALGNLQLDSRSLLRNPHARSAWSFGESDANADGV